MALSATDINLPMVSPGSHALEDIALATHAHPTLHETVGLVAELAAGTVTDVPNPARQKRAPKNNESSNKSSGRVKHRR